MVRNPREPFVQRRHRGWWRPSVRSSVKLLLVREIGLRVGCWCGCGSGWLRLGCKRGGGGFGCGFWRWWWCGGIVYLGLCVVEQSPHHRAVRFTPVPSIVSSYGIRFGIPACFIRCSGISSRLRPIRPGLSPRIPSGTDPNRQVCEHPRGPGSNPRKRRRDSVPVQPKRHHPDPDNNENDWRHPTPYGSLALSEPCQSSAPFGALGFAVMVNVLGLPEAADSSLPLFPLKRFWHCSPVHSHDKCAPHRSSGIEAHVGLQRPRASAHSHSSPKASQSDSDKPIAEHRCSGNDSAFMRDCC